MKKLREPSRTVTTGTVAGAFVILASYVLTSIWPGLTIPPEVSAAATLLISSLAAWLVPDPPRRPNAKH